MARGGPGVSKRTWFQAEDDRLVELVKALGVTSWIAIAGEIGRTRSRSAGQDQYRPQIGRTRSLQPRSRSRVHNWARTLSQILITPRVSEPRREGDSKRDAREPRRTSPDAPSHENWSVDLHTPEPVIFAPRAPHTVMAQH